VCPKCQSGAVRLYEDGLESKASCSTCGWGGGRSDVFIHTFTSDQPINTDDMVQWMSNDIARTLMAVGVRECGKPLFAETLGRLLQKWGFAWWGDAPPKDNREQEFRLLVTTRYAMAIGRGVLSALLEERVALEKERIRHER